MKYNQTTIPVQEYTAPEAAVVELLSKEAALLGTSQLEDFDENIIL